MAVYHNGGATTPTVVTVTAPAGMRVTGAGPARTAAGVLSAAAGALPGSRLADWATTGDPRFATRDERTAFGLVFTPPAPGGGFGRDLTPRIAAAAAAPSGWKTGMTGLSQLAAGGTARGKGALAEVVLGGAGALLVLIYVFASFLALLPPLMAAIAIPTTFLLVGGLTHLTPVSIIVEFLIALIGLGVATDYSLGAWLVVTRPSVPAFWWARWRKEQATRMNGVGLCHGDENAGPGRPVCAGGGAGYRRHGDGVAGG